MRLVSILLRKPSLSIIGLMMFVFAIVMKVSFIFATDFGMLMLTSVFFSAFILWSAIWGIFGFLELYMLLKEIRNKKLRFKNNEIDQKTFEDYMSNTKFSFIIIITYVVIVIFLAFYILFNWDDINI